MLNDWQITELGRVATFQRGFDLPTRLRNAGSVPIVSSAGTTDTHSSAKVQPPGVVTGRYGTIGELFFLQEAFWPLNTTLYVRDFHGNDPKFIFYLLHRFDFKSFSGKSGVPGVNRNELHRELVRIPTDPAEQRTIAGVLSDVDGLIGALDGLIAKKRDLKQAAMQQLLTGRTRLPGFSGGWRTRPLGEVVSRCTSGATPRRARPEYYKGSIPWITSGELNYNVIMDTAEKLTPLGVQDTNLSLIPAGTFLMAITGLEAEGTRGSCGIVGRPSTTNQSCMAVFPTSELVTGYLYHYYVLRGTSLALQYCQGTKQQSYTAKLVQQLPIDLPPTTDEQVAIAQVLSDMDAEIAALESRRDKTRLLKQGMMQQLLTGAIRLPLEESADTTRRGAP